MNKLEELDALVKAATPGPWAAQPDSDGKAEWDVIDARGMFIAQTFQGAQLYDRDRENADANAALIVWLVNNAPAMLSAQAEDNARLRERLGHLLSIDSQHDRTPRIIDIAYTAFMRAKDANDEDGGATDWMTDTRPLVLEAIAQHRAALGSPPDA